jgi:cysteine desulfurase
MAMEAYEKESQYIDQLKQYMKSKLTAAIPGVGFNSPDHSLYTVLSVCIPQSPKTESLLLELDMAGICVSSGSACTTGEGSHVIRALRKNNNSITIRFSFSKFNTQSEIDVVVAKLKELLS